jgi:hypothetical protein
MRTFAVCQMVGGSPNVDFFTTPVHGYVLAAELPLQWGLYLFSGTPAQMTALNALPQVTGLCTLTEYRFDEWVELDGVITSTVRTQLNTWLTKYSLPNIPAAWTYRRVFAGLFDLYRTNSPSLADTISTAFRTVINGWLTARGITNIPAAWTYLQTVQAIEDRMRVRWPEIGDTVDPAVRTKLNTWLTARGYPNIPAGWTYRRLLQEVYERMNQPYDLNGVNVAEL